MPDDFGSGDRIGFGPRDWPGLYAPAPAPAAPFPSGVYPPFVPDEDRWIVAPPVPATRPSAAAPDAVAPGADLLADLERRVLVEVDAGQLEAAALGDHLTAGLGRAVRDLRSDTSPVGVTRKTLDHTASVVTNLDTHWTVIDEGGSVSRLEQLHEVTFEAESDGQQIVLPKVVAASLRGAATAIGLVRLAAVIVAIPPTEDAGTVGPNPLRVRWGDDSRPAPSTAPSVDLRDRPGATVAMEVAGGLGALVGPLPAVDVQVLALSKRVVVTPSSSLDGAPSVAPVRHGMRIHGVEEAEPEAVTVSVTLADVVLFQRSSLARRVVLWPDPD